MSAVPRPPQPTLWAMQTQHLDAVMQIEARCYSFPWSRGNFVDSLAAGYLARMLTLRPGVPIGYFIAMAGVGEMHLLNLTVAPEHQGHGYASMLLDALEAECRQRDLPQLWLEVRASNERALSLYRRRGFVEIGQRRHYYPAVQGQREDATVMRLLLEGRSGDGGHDAVE